MADETNHNQAGEVAPSTVDKQVPSISEPVATNIPTANAPDPKAANPKVNPNAAQAADGAEKPAAAKAAKKEKAPAVEDKPFAEFIQQEYIPALQKAIADEGVQDLQLAFAKQKLPIAGLPSDEEYWQVIGSWQNGQRQFNVYFPDEDIQGKKGFSCNEGKKTSTLESFLIDERKTTLDLLVFGLVRRLNSQKWLGRN
ncbi:DUF2996 domain-containing protein [Nostoc sp. FACHB-87]|uniref:DUF2996 domain-containing protein n=1 Tax=Nostocales TaxID=1161 RepID=UPI00168907A2|nr:MULTISPECIES: DUF2996 domain-containing protein [Nostocales]MBD2300249.1 DUF2996 domain-containing protein [Nostoc sp. FACHB-190]MBD2455801.1 DUF2996 domain-containing protein [Nostoc sp. FACHB-87]MBD2477144.1 DUF2996 domain-containing protein [Anabaena sp. FACHB-83]MBD2486041.1 DUF2996 domain-containing protein [Aulosira sp. FACHB-615]